MLGVCVDIDIRGWQWIFYVIGWITGVFQPLFWIIIGLSYLIMDRPKEIKFLNKKLHERVFYWGCAVFIIMWLSFVGFMLG